MVGQIRIMTGKLSARTVETVTEPGRYSDGNGLYLVVRDGGSRQWFLFYRYGGKRRELGLGRAGKGGVGLAEVRKLADEQRALVRQGKNPK